MPLLARSVGLAGGLLLACTALVPAAPSAGPPPTSAAMSPVTRAFLANLVPNVDFLERSSRFALTNSKNARLRAFALSEVREQTRAIDALYDWTLSAGHPPVAAQKIQTKDLTATALPAQALDTTPTGSTAPGWPPANIAAAKSGAADARLPRGQEDLDSLEGLEGAAFDADYKATQEDALGQVETDYRDYVDHGDDAALLALAKRQLPRIKAYRAGLTKL